MITRNLFHLHQHYAQSVTFGLSGHGLNTRPYVTHAAELLTVAKHLECNTVSLDEVSASSDIDSPP